MIPACAKLSSQQQRYKFLIAEDADKPVLVYYYYHLLHQRQTNISHDIIKHYIIIIASNLDLLLPRSSSQYYHQARKTLSQFSKEHQPNGFRY